MLVRKQVNPYTGKFLGCRTPERIRTFQDIGVFLAKLQGTSGRLLIASCRSQDGSWETSAAKHVLKGQSVSLSTADHRTLAVAMQPARWEEQNVRKKRGYGLPVNIH